MRPAVHHAPGESRIKCSFLADDGVSACSAHEHTATVKQSAGKQPSHTRKRPRKRLLVMSDRAFANTHDKLLGLSWRRFSLFDASTL